MLIENPVTDSIEKKASREGYGQSLLELGEKNERVVVLDADLSGSTQTAKFGKKFPERFLNFGVAEQNMVGHAAGLALSGMLPIASSFAIFLTGRAWEIVRNSVAYPSLNVKLAASHAGITLGEDGASHQIIEDIGLMRSIPGMNVFVPADYWQAYDALLEAVEIQGPCYIRLGRAKRAMLYSKEEVPSARGVHIIQQGGKVAFLATGVMVYEAWKAAKILEESLGIKPWVVNIARIKPIEEKPVLDIAQQVQLIYTFEEHNILTGFGSAISELLSERNPIQVKKIGLRDSFGQSGTCDALMEHYGLNAEKLAASLADDPELKKLI